MFVICLLAHALANSATPIFFPVIYYSNYIYMTLLRWRYLKRMCASVHACMSAPNKSVPSKQEKQIEKNEKCRSEQNN